MLVWWLDLQFFFFFFFVFFVMPLGFRGSQLLLMLCLVYASPDPGIPWESIVANAVSRVRFP